METKAISVNQIAEMIKLDFLYELGKEIIGQSGIELLPDIPDNEQHNKVIIQFAAAKALDTLGIPANAFDHIFKKKAIETLEKNMLRDLRDLNNEAAKEAMIEGDIDTMMKHLLNVSSLTDVLEK